MLRCNIWNPKILNPRNLLELLHFLAGIWIDHTGMPPLTIRRGVASKTSNLLNLHDLLAGHRIGHTGMRLLTFGRPRTSMTTNLLKSLTFLVGLQNAHWVREEALPLSWPSPLHIPFLAADPLASCCSKPYSDVSYLPSRDGKRDQPIDIANLLGRTQVRAKECSGGFLAVARRPSVPTY